MKMHVLTKEAFLLLFLLPCIHSADVERIPYTKLRNCDLKYVADEIASYETVVKDIVEYVMGPFKGKTYAELASFADRFGARPSGSEDLENSIDYMIQLSREEGIDDIRTQDVEVPHWIRGDEILTMLKPRVKNIALLGLGKSVSTAEEGITAEVVVISDFDKLEATSHEEIKGKIVLFDSHFTKYGETVDFRKHGAVKAAKKGAIACLVRSIAPFSIHLPHTGSQTYEANVTQIPAAAITIEDADLIRKLYDRGESILLHLKMFSTFDTKISRNTIIDLKGVEKPEKLVIVSGHIDSWDVGQGAMDDGGGLFITWAVPVILERLSLKPRRTVRSIFWTAEEFGLVGANAYEQKFRNDSANINFIMESDLGTFAPLGLAVAGTQEARCIVSEILNLFKFMNASELVEDDSPGSDIGVFIKKGVPGASLHNANDKYYWFHHTEGDTMKIEKPIELDLCTAFWTAVAYIIADLSIDVPRKRNV